MTGCVSRPKTALGIDDFTRVAGEIVTELLVLKEITDVKKETGKAPVIEVGNIRNDTDLRGLDIEGQIVSRILEDLINARANGEPIVTAITPPREGWDGNPPKVDFRITGRAMVHQERKKRFFGGDMIIKTYTFQLRLNAARTDTVVWQRTKDVETRRR